MTKAFDTTRLWTMMDAHPMRVIAGLAVLVAALWGVASALVHPNLPLDVIEGLAWGREMQWGYAKHPPMQAWLLELTAFITARADWGAFLLSYTAIAVALMTAGRLALDIVTPRLAVASVVLLLGVHYLGLTAVEFNPNVLLIPFWALAGWAFMCALRTPEQARWWLILGLCVGAGFYVKYTIMLLAAVMGAFLILDPAARAVWRTRGPWLAGLAALLVATPHLAWLVGNHGMPFAYAADRAEVATTGFIQHISHPLQFALAQFLALLPVAMLALVLFPWRRGAVPPESSAADHTGFDPMHRRALTVLCWGPFLVLLVLSAVTGMRLRSMWGVSLWVFMGAWLMAATPWRWICDDRAMRRLFMAASALMVIWEVALICIYPLSPILTGKGKRALFPGRDMAARIDHEWSAQFPGQPLPYVVGDIWLAGNVGWYAKARPHVWIADQLVDPAARFKAADSMKQGAVLIWSDAADLAHWSAEARSLLAVAQKMPDLVLEWQSAAPLSPILVHWAIVPARVLTP